MTPIPRLLFVFFLFFVFSSVDAHHILFYYNSSDGTNGGLLQCVTILQNAGHQVTTVDVQGEQRNPANDNWGSPYDQVWDMRFVDRDSRTCGSGLPGAADYFDEHWRNKAAYFLNHCGKLFVAGEYYTYVDRDEGIYRFLQGIQAVKPGYDNCPPSIRGNNSTTGPAYYKVHNQLGPGLFYGDMVGGIPLACLTGTSFVDSPENWEGDRIHRSIVSGWEGRQLGGIVNAPLCDRGKLFMVWDATMWTLWQPGAEEEKEPVAPVWDESAWFSYDSDQTNSHQQLRNFQKARSITKKFFPAIAQWLGSRDCPCTEVAAPSSAATTTLRNTVPTTVPVFPATSSLPTTTGSLLSAGTPASTFNSTSSSNAPETIVFNNFPVNIYIKFRDGAGDYRLAVWDSKGHFLEKIFDQDVSKDGESWATWDGNNQGGTILTPGNYYAVLSKDGRTLRKIVLSWVGP